MDPRLIAEIDKRVDSRIATTLDQACDNADMIRHRDWLIVTMAVVIGFLVIIFVVTWFLESLPFWVKISVTGILAAIALYSYGRLVFW